jgi:hypothetical protein
MALMPFVARLLAALMIVLTLGGCAGGDDEATDCRPDDEWFPRERITIAEALEQKPDGLVSIRGALLHREGQRPRLCSSLAESYPPKCGEPSIAIEGLGNLLRAVEGLNVTGRGDLQPTNPRVAWLESSTGGGRLDGRVLRVEPACSSKRAIDHFREETGQELALDGFLSNSGLEHLNFDSLENEATARQRRREWGHFSIVVFLEDKDRALQEAFEQISNSVGDAPPVRPDERGIVWHSGVDTWIALKEYDGGVVLEWEAGPRRVTDRRWERLDEILSKL